ncbi:MAG: hypothetical protein HYX48_01770 [Chlamydiales bacterium]|nr:hypothetical protein [Chlamydiales bacterium]
MFKRILSLMAILVVNICFADISTPVLNDEVIMEIAANENDCIQRIEDGKIYLNPDRILATRAGVLLNLNNRDFVLLPTLNSDAEGCYIPEKVEILNRCPWCNKSYFIRCKNPDCPGKQ